MMKTMRMVVLLGLVPLASLGGLAQTPEGRILGILTDQQGGAVVGAKVSITNVGTGVSRALSSNQTGDYVAPNLSPGVYTIVVEAAGFKRIERAGIRVEVATDVREDFQLVPGTVTEVVRVTGEAPLVETTNDNVGGSLSNKAVNDLPLNGRDYQNLLVLRPGVQRSPGGGFESITANGMRPEDNNFIVEGTDNNDPYYSGNVINAEGVQGTPGSILPIDAIQEFNSEENPSAEYGWKPGATVNIGLKSGTNEFHGTGYYFGRNNALDARNVFNAVTDPSTGLHEPQRALHQHQFGGSIGGPIWKNKTFFFGAYEGVRGFVSNADSVSVPVMNSLSGDFTNSIPDALTDLMAHQSGAPTFTCAGVPVNSNALSPVSANLIGCGTFTGNGPFPGIFPSNPGTNASNVTAVSSGFPNVNGENTFLVKLDHHISDHHALSGRYLFGKSKQTEQDATVLRQQWRSQSDLLAQVAGVNWTWTPSGNWVNEARVGYNRFWQTILAADHALNPLTAYGLNTGVTNPTNFGLPEIDISNFTSLGNVSGWPLETVPNTTYQFADNVSYTHAAHTFRFGGEFRIGSTDNLRNRSGKGRITFSGGNNPNFPTATPLEDFLAGFPGTGKIFVGDSARHVSIESFGLFFQDDWRLSPRLTVNLGLRYELNTVIKECHNRLGNFDPNIPAGLEQVGVNISSPYDGDHDNFAPRVGIAWDPWGRGKTVFRAGAGINYEIPHISIFIGQNGVDNDIATTGLNAIPTGAIGSPIKGNIVTTGVSVSPCTGPASVACLNWNQAVPGAAIFTGLASALNCNPGTGGSPCDITAVTRHLSTPYVASWNLNVQQALTSTTSLQVAYVGNRGINLYSIRDINQTNVNSPAAKACFGPAGPTPFNTTCEQAGRPFNTKFPFLGFINMLENLDTSDFHSLQVTATQRIWHGLTFLAGYTWGHSIDDASFNRATQPQDSTRPGAERASSDQDLRHRFTLALTYELPSRKSLGQLLEGWQINSIVTSQGGTPWGVTDGFVSGTDISATGEFADRWNLNGPASAFRFSTSGPVPCTDKKGNPAFVGGVCQAYENGLLTIPAAGTFGNAPRNVFRGPRLDNWDLSIVKNTKLRERVNMQIRGEFFNVLNHPHFGNPMLTALSNIDPSVSGSFGFAGATPDVAAANPVIGTGGPRNIQLGMKFIF